MKREKDTNTSENSEQEAENEEEPVKKTQGQLIQEALGLDQETIVKIEKQLFISKFIDSISEDIFDYIYRDRILEKYMDMLKKNMNELDETTAAFMQETFEQQQIEPTISDLKSKAEEIAQENDITTSLNSKLRKNGLIGMLPLCILVILIYIIPPDFTFYLMIPLCFLCFLPQFLRSRIVQKWNDFKEENKKIFYQENREKILLLKEFVQITLDNIHNILLDKKIPLELIKFSLSSSDYKNLKLINEQVLRGGITQYFFTFEYPPGVEPFPIPEIIKEKYMEPIGPKKITEEVDNFLILKNIKVLNGEIEKFEVELKEELKDDINTLLNSCKFEKTKDFSLIMPNYTPETAIHCICGEIAEFSIVQKCSWIETESEEKFEFYLFESEKCKCGEKVFVLSLMEEKVKIPDKWKNIFS